VSKHAGVLLHICGVDGKTLANQVRLGGRSLTVPRYWVRHSLTGSTEPVISLLLTALMGQAASYNLTSKARVGSLTSALLKVLTRIHTSPFNYIYCHSVIARHTLTTLGRIWMASSRHRRDEKRISIYSAVKSLSNDFLVPR